MDGFALLMGHLVGDYLLQNDWQAKNKTNPPPEGWRPATFVFSESGYGGWTTPGTVEDARAWDLVWKKWLLGHLACTLHCLLYTLAIFLCSFWWMPWWGLLLCFLIHWPIDRFRLARRFMDWTGQQAFATGVFAPWSIIVVDNTWHLLTLLLIAALAGKVGP